MVGWVANPYTIWWKGVEFYFHNSLWGHYLVYCGLIRSTKFDDNVLVLLDTFIPFLGSHLVSRKKPQIKSYNIRAQCMKSTMPLRLNVSISTCSCLHFNCIKFLLMGTTFSIIFIRLSPKIFIFRFSLYWQTVYCKYILVSGCLSYQLNINI